MTKRMRQQEVESDGKLQRRVSVFHVSRGHIKRQKFIYSLSDTKYGPNNPRCVKDDHCSNGYFKVSDKIRIPEFLPAAPEILCLLTAALASEALFFDLLLMVS